MLDANNNFEYIPCQEQHCEVMLVKQDNGYMVVTHVNTLPEAQKLVEATTAMVLEQTNPTILV